jgi:hypothetical protein
MIPPFDILRVDAEGRPRWVQAIATLDAAMVRVTELIKSRPAEYVIVSHQTGSKVSIKPEGKG